MVLENSVVICCLFYLLGMLSVDLVVDLGSDITVQRGYYCVLLSSFSTISGLLRLAPAAILLAVSSVLAFYKSRSLQKKLHATSILILVLCGLPAFFKTSTLVHGSCQGGLFPTLAILRYHYVILAVLILSLTLQIIISLTSSKRKIQ